MSFNHHLRSQVLEGIANQVYDVCIIGGGATGAGIALDCAQRGLKTLLLEKQDFASGTSSRSTKLIHGGLRYLKQLDIGLVREVGRERAIVHRNAPHLVHPEELLLPIVENGSLGKYSTPVGLWLYEKLAGVPKNERFYTIDEKETLQAEPLLNPEIIKGGAVYREYRTDDARLVISLIRTAHSLGADLLNYCQVDAFNYDDKTISGLEFSDKLNGASYRVQSKSIVNAAGPWCDEVRSKDHEISGKRLRLTKGVHLVFDREKLPLKRSVYFDVAGDKRMVFAIPRMRCTYLGTTDTLYSDDINNPNCSWEDVQYLLNAANHVFPELNLKAEDVESTWSGLRPLIHEEGKGPTELSRKDEIFIADSGLISIAGGKLTGYRTMAERCTDRVMASLTAQHQIEFQACESDQVKLLGGDFDHYAEIEPYKQKLLGEARQVNASREWIDHLVNTYGRDAERIIETAYELYPKSDSSEDLILQAEIEFSIEEEMCHNLQDFLIRRTGRLYFRRPNLLKIYKRVADIFAQKLNWSEEKKAIEILNFEQELEAVMMFREEMNQTP